MNLPENIPKDLSELLHKMAADFSAMLRDNLVGLYLWGSLTYAAFDETCSDVDCIAVTRRDLDDREFSDHWFKNSGQHNRWVKRIEIRFVIDQQFLDKTSHCCGFYHHTGKLIRHGSDGRTYLTNAFVNQETSWSPAARSCFSAHLGRKTQDAFATGDYLILSKSFVFSIVPTLFAAVKTSILFVFNPFRTLCQKPPGVGELGSSWICAAL